MVNEMRIALSVALNIHSGGSTHGSEGNEDKVSKCICDVMKLGT